MVASYTKERIEFILSQVTKGPISLASEMPSMGDTADMLNALADKFNGQNRFAAKAIELAVSAQRCRECHGAKGCYRAGTGDEWVDCDACEGSGKAGV